MVIWAMSNQWNASENRQEYISRDNISVGYWTNWTPLNPNNRCVTWHYLNVIQQTGGSQYMLRDNASKLYTPTCPIASQFTTNLQIFNWKCRGVLESHQILSFLPKMCEENYIFVNRARISFSRWSNAKIVNNPAPQVISENVCRSRFQHTWHKKCTLCSKDPEGEHRPVTDVRRLKFAHYYQTSLNSNALLMQIVKKSELIKLQTKCTYALY
jgi:hypothetical protein